MCVSIYIYIYIYIYILSKGSVCIYVCRCINKYKKLRFSEYIYIYI